MMQFRFGPLAAFLVVANPFHDQLAVRISAGRNAVMVHMASPIGAKIGDELVRAAPRAGSGRQLQHRTSNGRPVDLRELLQRIRDRRASSAEVELLSELMDRMGLLQ